MDHVSMAIMIHTWRNKGARGLPELTDINFKSEQCRLNKKRYSLNPLITFVLMDLWIYCMLIFGVLTRLKGETERDFLTIIDDFSRRASIYPIIMKYDAFDVRIIIRAEIFFNR